MAPNTGLALILLGIAGALRDTEGVGRVHKWLSVLAATVVLVLALATLAEYALDIDLGIDRLLVPPDRGVRDPERPAALAAVGLALLASSSLSCDTRLTARARPAEWLAVAGGLTALTALLGLIFDAAPLYRSTQPSGSGVSLPTAVGLSFISLGLLLSRTCGGLMRVAVSSGPGGVLLKRLALPAVLAPVFLGAALTALLHGVGVKDLGWFAPTGAELTDSDWERPGVTLGMFLDGEEIHSRGHRGERVVDESFLVVLHSGDTPVGFTLPGVPWAKSYEFVLDTSTEDEPYFKPEAGSTLDVLPRSVLLLRAQR